MKLFLCINSPPPCFKLHFEIRAIPGGGGNIQTKWEPKLDQQLQGNHTSQQIRQTVLLHHKQLDKFIPCTCLLIIIYLYSYPRYIGKLTTVFAYYDSKYLIYRFFITSQAIVMTFARAGFILFLCPAL